jgi:DNA-binding response OmpR family regulator
MSDERPGAILIMDDDPDVRDAMARILARLGRPVLVAATIDEARRRCEDGPPVRLIVADLGLVAPEAGAASGLADRLGCGPPRPRVVYVSGLTRSVAERRGLLTATDVLVTKPFTAAVLRAAVTAAL